MDTFFNSLNMMKHEVDGARPSIMQLVQQNIVEPTARHLMLLTRNNAALGSSSPFALSQVRARI